MIYEFDGFRPVIHESSFIHPNATVTGNVTIGRDVYVGPGAAIRGDWGAVVVEDGCNVQENCTIHMFPGVTVVLEAAAHIGHGAIVRALLAAGARRTALDPAQEFISACLSVDWQRVDELVTADPTVVRHAIAAEPATILRAAELRRPDAIRLLAEKGVSARVLVLTTFDTDTDVVPAIEAGATGYLLKDSPPDELLRGVRAAARSEAVLSPWSPPG